MLFEVDTYFSIIDCFASLMTLINFSTFLSVISFNVPLICAYPGSLVEVWPDIFIFILGFGINST